MKTVSLKPSGWVALSLVAFWGSLSSALCGCDVEDLPPPPIGPAATQAPTVYQPGKSSECGDDLAKIVESKADTLRCHSECADLFAECLTQEAPECYACEHEAAICRSTCEEPALWGAF